MVPTTKTVYCFYSYEPGSGRLVHSPRAATLETIERLDGVPMKETRLEVPESAVDADGFYDGPANCANHAHPARV